MADHESYPPLISLAVHEFRTPASVVGGYLRMLLRDAESPLPDRQRRMIEEAEKSCARIVAIVSELSDIGKLDSGAIALAREAFDVFPLVSDVAEHVQEGKDREVRVELRGRSEGGVVRGDATRLRAAFEAIFRAILREKVGPTTVVVARRIENLDGKASAVVVVAEEASVQAAYDRSAGPFDEKRGGLGLALPLARRVIEGHGGRLWAPAAHDGANDPLSRGAAIVSLPIEEQGR